MNVTKYILNHCFDGQWLHSSTHRTKQELEKEIKKMQGLGYPYLRAFEVVTTQLTVEGALEPPPIVLLDLSQTIKLKRV